jgi:hypothetical protein
MYSSPLTPALFRDLHAARGRWEIGWAPRIFVAERNAMRPDGNRYDLDADGYAWDEFPLRWAGRAP